MGRPQGRTPDQTTQYGLRQHGGDAEVQRRVRRSLPRQEDLKIRPALFDPNRAATLRTLKHIGIRGSQSACAEKQSTPPQRRPGSQGPFLRRGSSGNPITSKREGSASPCAQIASLAHTEYEVPDFIDRAIDTSANCKTHNSQRLQRQLSLVDERCRPWRWLPAPAVERPSRQSADCRSLIDQREQSSHALPPSQTRR